ncbi:MAG: PrsW family intramembrane metalloprotease [Candidatus Zixiibacteriota bacterium]|nr:MAG: PrsW family intramembrane metalloprotease [candidate division Zixibacteria bacterium]
MIEFIKIFVSLVPVFVLLALLILLDSYKLVSLRSAIKAIGAGCLVAIVGLYLNTWLTQILTLSVSGFSAYIAPLTEESLKALYIVYLLRRTRIGFLVDAAIYGFAIGAGFAFVENIYYLSALTNSNILLWVVRGFGTAVMHGSTAAILGMISKYLSDRYPACGFVSLLPGMGAAIIVHAVYNNFLISPLYSTVILLTFLPLLVIFVFERSEKATQRWLGIGLDADMELLDLIISGNISQTRIGVYLESLKSRFRGEVVADMLCLLRLQLELSLQVKGIILMREVGIPVSPEPQLVEKFAELKYLEKSIGKTGKLAILPFFRSSSKDLWQRFMLNKWAGESRERRSAPPR